MATHRDIARELGELGRSDARLLDRQARLSEKLDEVTKGLEHNRSRRCEVLHDLLDLDRAHLDDDTIITAAAPKNEPPPPRDPPGGG